MPPLLLVRVSCGCLQVPKTVPGGTGPGAGSRAVTGAACEVHVPAAEDRATLSSRDMRQSRYHRVLAHDDGKAPQEGTVLGAGPDRRPGSQAARPSRVSGPGTLALGRPSGRELREPVRPGEAGRSGLSTGGPSKRERPWTGNTEQMLMLEKGEVRGRT